MEKLKYGSGVPRLLGVTRHKTEDRCRKQLRRKPTVFVALICALGFGIYGYLGATDAYLLAAFALFFSLVLSLPRSEGSFRAEEGFSRPYDRELMIGTAEYNARQRRLGNGAGPF